MIALVKSNKFLGNFVLNEKIFIKDDLKGNQYETLGIFFYMERLLLTMDQNMIDILNKKHQNRVQEMWSLSKNIKE